MIIALSLGALAFVEAAVSIANVPNAKGWPFWFTFNRAYPYGPGGPTADVLQASDDNNGYYGNMGGNVASGGGVRRDPNSPDVTTSTRSGTAASPVSSSMSNVLKATWW